MRKAASDTGVTTISCGDVMNLYDTAMDASDKKVRRKDVCRPADSEKCYEKNSKNDQRREASVAERGRAKAQA
jgi:hypothetical protein